MTKPTQKIQPSPLIMGLAIVSRKHLTPNGEKLLSTLIDLSDSSLSVALPISTLLIEAGISESSFASNIKKLVSLGFVKTVRRHRKSNLYIIQHREIFKAACLILSDESKRDDDQKLTQKALSGISDATKSKLAETLSALTETLMYNTLDLTKDPEARLLLVVLASLSKAGQVRAGNDELASIMGTTEAEVAAALQRLIDAGYIEAIAASEF